MAFALDFHKFAGRMSVALVLTDGRSAQLEVAQEGVQMNKEEIVTNVAERTDVSADDCEKC